MRTPEEPIEGSQDRLPPASAVTDHLANGAQIATAQTLRVGECASPKKVVATVAEEQHLGPAGPHPSEDLLIAGTPSEKRSVGAERNTRLGFEAPETLGLDRLNLQTELIGHHPAVRPLVTLREAIENERIGANTDTRDALRERGHRGRIETAAHRDSHEAAGITETVGDRLLENLAEVKSVVLVPRVADLGGPRAPVPLHAHTAGFGDQPLPRGQLADGGEKAALRILAAAVEIGRDLDLVIVVGNRGMPKDLDGVGGEADAPG